jgi:hypothetical protein
VEHEVAREDGRETDEEREVDPALPVSDRSRGAEEHERHDDRE